MNEFPERGEPGARQDETLMEWQRQLMQRKMIRSRQAATLAVASQLEIEFDYPEPQPNIHPDQGELFDEQDSN